MHEFSLALKLIQAIEEKATEHGATRVLSVKLKIGCATAVVPQYMESAFELAKRGTLAEGAKLHLEMMPIILQCRKCGCTYEANEFLTPCPKCEHIGNNMLSGDELLIEHMELEVPVGSDKNGAGNATQASANATKSATSK